MAGNGATEARNQRHLPSQQQFFLEQSEERFGGGAFSCSSGSGAVATSVNVCAGTGVMAELAVSILRAVKRFTFVPTGTCIKTHKSTPRFSTQIG